MSDNDRIFAALLDIKSDIGTTKGHVETIRKSIPELFDRTGALQTQADLMKVEVKTQEKRIGILETKVGKAGAIVLFILGGGFGGKELYTWIMKSM